MNSNELRKRFLDFFAERGHTIVESDNLVPRDDPTLLFTGSGMNQFKKEFLGDVKEYRRAASCQKCLRTDDLDKVGLTKGHHTFFEMLGNFSFGDYFKKETLAWAWEFVTEELNIPSEKLWGSVYTDDTAALEIWLKDIGVSPARIVKLGAKENFWPANAPEKGPNGPCGPCSEIFYDRGEKFGCGKPDCGPSCNCGRFVEVWNLVFTQFERKPDGELVALPEKNIDTGMGLERMASVLQDVPNNFETDSFKPIVKHIEKIAAEKNPASVYAIADHIRAVTFLVADGVLPGNEGRGYVERLLIRRAINHGRNLRIKGNFLYKMVPLVAEVFKEPYPELVKRRENISQIVLSEEERFKTSLEKAKVVLGAKLSKSKGKKIQGADVFELYDTYGLPFELIERLAKQKGFSLDTQGFKRLLDEQRRRSRQGSTLSTEIFAGKQGVSGIKETSFLGYETLSVEVKALSIIKNGKEVDAVSEGEEAEVLLNKTPFYGEAGGQVGDSGVLTAAGLEAEVRDAKKINEQIVHLVKIIKGELKKGARLKAQVERGRRLAIARNHTATHLLHYALRKVLGEHVQQAGSFVGYDGLRFDFTHFKPVSPEQRRRIERLVNEMIIANEKVRTLLLSKEEALKSGAIALFGEKYGGMVRVVSIGDYSKELCGGTHLEQTGRIGLFKLVSEESIAGGVRRLAAVTGIDAYMRTRKNELILEELSGLLKKPVDLIIDSVKEKVVQLKDMGNEIEAVNKKLIASRIDSMVEKACLFTLKGTGTLTGTSKDSKIVSERMDNLSVEFLRFTSDLLKEKIKTGVILLASVTEKKIIFIIRVTADLVKKGLDAGELIKEISALAGGRGGGKANLAQGGSSHPEKLNRALEGAVEIIKGYIK